MVKRSELIKIIKEELTQVLLEEVDLEDHAKKVAFEKKVLPMLNQELKKLNPAPIDQFKQLIQITAATGDVQVALEKIRKTLDDPEFAKKYPLEKQVTFLARFIGSSAKNEQWPADMNGAKGYTKTINDKYKKFKRTHMDRVKAKARERAAAVQKAALGSEKTPGVSQGTISKGRVDPGSVKGTPQER